MIRPIGAASALLLSVASAWAAGAGILPGSNGKEPYTIDAAKLDYLEKDGKLIYSGDVIATQGPSKVKGAVMTIYLDKPAGGGDRQVRRIEMKGPVTVVQNGKIGIGDTGLYDKTENKWYLLGNVTLTEGTDVTQGDKLIYDLSNSTALVDAGKQGRVKSVFTPRDSTKDAGTQAAASERPTDIKPAPKPKPGVKRAEQPLASRP